MSQIGAPVSAVVKAGDWLVLSGQFGDRNGALVSDRFIDQAGQALRNVESELQQHGARIEHIVKTTVYLTDMADLDVLNDMSSRFFGSHHPSRSVLADIALPLGARVEIEAWAYLAEGSIHRR